MITAEFEIELLCFIRDYELKGYEFSLNRNFETYKGIDISIHVACPHPFKIIKAMKSTPFSIGDSVFLKSSKSDLEQFMRTVKLYDSLNNKRAA